LIVDASGTIVAFDAGDGALVRFAPGSYDEGFLGGIFADYGLLYGDSVAKIGVDAFGCIIALIGDTPYDGNYGPYSLIRFTPGLRAFGKNEQMA
jgi:hypothetical protein